MFLLSLTLLQYLTVKCSGSALTVIMTEPGVMPGDDWTVELLDSALDNLDDFTICGRVKNYKFKRSSNATVWESILSTEKESYLLISVPMECENKYIGCTDNYRYYLGKSLGRFWQ